MHRHALLTALAFGTIACGERAVPEADTDSEPDIAISGAFAFVGESGRELLAIDVDAEPATLTHAVCSSGNAELRFLRSQVASAESNGRHVAANLANEAGALFAVANGSLEPDETCFVTTPALVAAAVLPIPSEATACTVEMDEALSQHARRELLHCWQLAAAGSGTIIVAAQFVSIDTSALAALALFDGDLRLFHPFPGHGGSDDSVWRVDDGGVFDPQSLHILFAARLPQGHALAFLWAGAEGESEHLVLADSTAAAQRVISAYRYWSPL